MIRLLRSLFYRSPRVTRWAAVRHLDANDKRRREVIARNRADVRASLGGRR
jgi:hypothetical protein